jgi:hypothetical protein
VNYDFVELSQIISQCNIYEAGKKNEVFRYMEEQVTIGINTYRPLFFLSQKKTEPEIDAGSRQGPKR